jgi:TonB family protein
MRDVLTEFSRLVFRSGVSVVLAVAMLNGVVPPEVRGQFIVPDSTSSTFAQDPDYKAAKEAFARLDYSAAAKFYGRVLKKQPRSSEIRIALASLALLRDKPQEALKHAAKALEVDSACADAYYIEGRIRFLQNRIPDARIAVDKGLALNAKHWVLKTLQADVMMAERQFEPARAAFVEARSLAPREFDSSKRLTSRFEAVTDYLNYKDLTKDPGTTKARILNSPRPEYTPQARAYGVAGKVAILVRLNESGVADRVIVLTGLPDGLTDSAKKAVLMLKAEPATRDGKPIPSWSQVIVNFSIR